MQLRVKLVGSGKEGDPYRVSLPTYQLRHGNVTKGYAVVTIPDTTHPLTDDDLKHETAEETTEGPLYAELCEECVKKVHAHFDENYKEHVGKFRLEGVEHV